MSDEILDQLASQLIELAEDDDVEALEEFLNECEGKGYELTLDEQEEVEWDVEGKYEVATTTVQYSLKLGSKEIAQWTASYMGDNDGGTGWRITQTYSDISLDVETIIEVAFIRIEFPDVPKPRLISE